MSTVLLIIGGIVLFAGGIWIGSKSAKSAFVTLIDTEIAKAAGAVQTAFTNLKNKL